MYGWATKRCGAWSDVHSDGWVVGNGGGAYLDTASVEEVVELRVVGLHLGERASERLNVSVNVVCGVVWGQYTALRGEACRPSNRSYTHRVVLFGSAGDFLPGEDRAHLIQTSAGLYCGSGGS